MAKKRSSVISVLITGDNRELSTALDDSSNRLATFGKAAGAALAGVGLAFGAFAKSGLDAAIATEAAQERLATLLRNTGLASEAQIRGLNAQAQALEGVGVAAASNITVLQSQLATFDLSADAIRTLTPAITDYVIAEKGAAATSDDFQAAANGLAQALQGNFGALSRVGFVLDDTTKEMIANGTEAERAAALVDVLSSTYGGFNEKARETAAGGLQALRNQFGAVQEAVGTALLPILRRFIDWFAENEKTITDFATKVVGGLTTAIEWVADKFEEWGPKVREAVDTIREQLGRAKTFFDENIKVPATEAWDAIKTFASNVKTELAAMVSDLSPDMAGFKEFFSGLEFDDPKRLGAQLGEALGIAVEQALETLLGMSKKVGDTVGSMLSQVDWFKLGMDGVKYLVLLFSGLAVGFFGSDWFTPLLSALAANWDKVLLAVVGIMFLPAKWVGALGNALAKIPFLGRLLSWAVTSLNRLGSSIAAGFSAWVWQPFSQAVGRVLGAAGPGLMARFATMFRNIPTALRTALDDALLRLGMFFDDFGVRIGNALLPLKQRWTTLLDNMAAGIREFFITLREIGANMVRGLWEGIKSMGSWLTRQFKEFIDDAINGVKNLLGIRSPSKVFEGIGREVGLGFVAGIASTDRMIADATAFMGEQASASVMVNGIQGGGRGVGSTVNVTVTSADPQAVVDAIRRYTRQNGPLGQVVAV